MQENTKESEAEPDVTPFDAAVDLGLGRGPSVLVVVVSVSGVAVAVVHIVDVITVRHRDVAAILAVLVVMHGMRGVFGRLTLVVVTRVASVQVTVMHVVNVIIVRDGDVAAPFTMRVVVADMLDVSDRQRRPYTPLACHDSPLPAVVCCICLKRPIRRWDVRLCLATFSLYRTSCKSIFGGLFGELSPMSYSRLAPPPCPGRRADHGQ